MQGFSPRLVIEAAEMIGDAEVERLTNGHGLSGATPDELRAIVAAAIVEESAR